MSDAERFKEKSEVDKGKERQDFKADEKQLLKPKPVEVTSQPAASPDRLLWKEERPPVLRTISEEDSYIRERIDAQPVTLDEVKTRSTPRLSQGKHRLSLPEYFEGQSYDCTWGEGCPVHRMDDRHRILNRGEFVFRRVWKRKRAIDEAINLKGWFLVNRTYFPEVPKHLVSASGGVEEGDSILFFMPAEQALRVRRSSGEMSRERVRDQLTRYDNHEEFYRPRPEAEEESDGTPSNAWQEGRDFGESPFKSPQVSP